MTDAMRAEIQSRADDWSELRAELDRRVARLEQLTTEDAAAFLKTKPGTLAAWRNRRIGPPYIQVSERLPRYSRRAANGTAVL